MWLGVKMLWSPLPHLSTISSSASSGSAGTAGQERKWAKKEWQPVCYRAKVLEMLIAANETFLHLHTGFLAYRCEE